ncbi:antibiotic biosynthesis monooxygenase [Pararhodobacter sp. CCB-MM2]|uniref:antibiotic biosynthesis monooxygenase family protein n=1 Tax=Pararhodobacter sp. CCB-MM2 TaxID=1786003 RepID=UPI000832874D|nr:antibiotic biosynthesis monooxygenase [Pararhodobacter sp. CCB-MM2]
MIAVIFEVEPAEGQHEVYLDLAAALRPQLAQIDGFISVERFQSLTNPGKMLSLSFFRDEAAVARWREVSAHQSAQGRGRGGVFKDYRLRVAGVIRDYGLNDRAEAPQP